MATTRHPAYSSDALITSTEAARILRSNPHDPLAFRRLDQLRSTRKLVPIDIDDAHGPRFLRSDVEALARPWEHEDDDPVAAFRGFLVALTISAAIGAVTVFAIWAVTR
jgi:hypothetical protein